MEESRRYPFNTYDVFSSRSLEGNQLAVFTDARGLSGEEMQALARETNLSETTFVIPRAENVERERGVQVRIFTVEEELPFAGHPTLGTAYYLHRKTGAPLIELELKVGKIPVRFEKDENGLIRGEMRQRDPEFGRVHAMDAVAKALGMPQDIFDSSLPIQTVSTGMAFVIVPLRKLEHLQNLQFQWKAAAEYLKDKEGKFFYFVTRETVDPSAKLHARMIFYNGEDPATGSAAGCCMAWAAEHGVFASEQRAVIEQGLEMKRPSRIVVRATKDQRGVTNVRVGGNVVQVMSGEIQL